MKKNTLFILLTLLLSMNTFSQDEHEIESNEGKIHKVALVFGYTHIPSANEEGHETKSVLVPTIGVDYFMQFTKGWKIGVVLDLELNKYVVDFNREELERDKALVTGILVGYEFANRWSILLGPGIEFEKEKNLFLFRSSIEYEFELGKGWGLFPSFNYDFKEAYSTYSINIGISRRL